MRLKTSKGISDKADAKMARRNHYDGNHMMEITFDVTRTQRAKSTDKARLTQRLLGSLAMQMETAETVSTQSWADALPLPMPELPPIFS